jgi:dipeptidyl aminopeptidase/acylaminoacyl peptidase
MKHNTTYVHYVLPVWYVEGLADYFSYRYVGPGAELALKSYLAYLRDSGIFVPLTDLDEARGSQSQEYGEGNAFFKYVETMCGNQTITLFMDVAENNLDTEIALNRVFNITQAQFEAVFQDWVYANYTKNIVGSAMDVPKYGSRINITDTRIRTVKMPCSWGNGKILYVADDIDGHLQIFKANDDGTDLVQLTDGWETNTDPEWSPDGSKILFSSDRNGTSGVYSMSPDGIGATPVVDDGFVNLAGGWSPDGSRILFVSSRSGNYDIFSCDVDGADKVQLTNWPSSEGAPIFTADGKEIIFVSNKTGTYELYSMEEDGQNPRRLIANSDPFDSISDPYCSPDGKTVFYQVCKSQRADYLYSFDLITGESCLITGPATNDTYTNIYDPIWSEDGTEILFAYDGTLYRYQIFEKKISSAYVTMEYSAIVIFAVLLATACALMLVKHRRKKGTS